VQRGSRDSLGGSLEAVSVVVKSRDFKLRDLAGVVSIAETHSVAVVGVGLKLGAFEWSHRSALQSETEL
jgi:hypothetical protein